MNLFRLLNCLTIIAKAGSANLSTGGITDEPDSVSIQLQLRSKPLRRASEVSPAFVLRDPGQGMFDVPVESRRIRMGFADLRWGLAFVGNFLGRWSQWIFVGDNGHEASWIRRPDNRSMPYPGELELGLMPGKTPLVVDRLLEPDLVVRTALFNITPCSHLMIWHAAIECYEPMQGASSAFMTRPQFLRADAGSIERFSSNNQMS